jgi:hypothetical protein
VELARPCEKQPAIPGAFRVDPSRLRTSRQLTVPNDVDIVLYSSSGGATVPARAAVGLQRIGIDNLWVLEGGLRAWREQGFPLRDRRNHTELNRVIDQPSAFLQDTQLAHNRGRVRYFRRVQSLLKHAGTVDDASQPPAQHVQQSRSEGRPEQLKVE